LWSVDYNSPSDGFEEAKAVAVDSSENIVVVGYDDRFDIGESMNWMIRKYDPAGSLLWSRTYNSPADGWDVANAVAIDTSDNIIVVGEEDRPDITEGPNWRIRKYDSSGSVVWSRTYNGLNDGWDEATAVAVDTSGEGVDWYVAR